MNSTLTDQVRDAGYEALFTLGGFLALSLHPTQRNLDDILQWIDEVQSRREFLRNLERRGLIESAGRDTEWVPLLTEKGRAAFAGGRHPEAAWKRPWDGLWRALNFDLPRKQAAARMKLRRWLCNNHFGRLQGSLWICPDPIDGVAELIGDDRIDPHKIAVFEGVPAGNQSHREIAASAWDFDSIDSAYRDYTAFAERLLRNLRKTIPSRSRFQAILREDRQRWWEAIRRDPLLPKPLHPVSYKGPAAWKVRCRLLKKLGQRRDAAGPE